jgi:hypothetical protein
MTLLLVSCVCGIRFHAAGTVFLLSKVLVDYLNMRAADAAGGARYDAMKW